MAVAGITGNIGGIGTTTVSQSSGTGGGPLPPPQPVQQQTLVGGVQGLSGGGTSATGGTFNPDVSILNTGGGPLPPPQPVPMQTLVGGVKGLIGSGTSAAYGTGGGPLAAPPPISPVYSGPLATDYVNAAQSTGQPIDYIQLAYLQKTDLANGYQPQPVYVFNPPSFPSTPPTTIYVGGTGIGPINSGGVAANFSSGYVPGLLKNNPGTPVQVPIIYDYTTGLPIGFANPNTGIGDSYTANGYTFALGPGGQIIYGPTGSIISQTASPTQAIQAGEYGASVGEKFYLNPSQPAPSPLSVAAPSTFGATKPLPGLGLPQSTLTLGNQNQQTAMSNNFPGLKYSSSPTIPGQSQTPSNTSAFNPLSLNYYSNILNSIALDITKGYQNTGTQLQQFNNQIDGTIAILHDEISTGQLPQDVGDYRLAQAYIDKYLGNLGVIASRIPIINDLSNFIDAQPWIRAAINNNNPVQKLAGVVAITGEAAGLTRLLLSGATGAPLSTGLTELEGEALSIPELAQAAATRLGIGGAIGSGLYAGLGAVFGATQPQQVASNLLQGAQSGATFSGVLGGVSELPGFSNLEDYLQSVKNVWARAALNAGYYGGQTVGATNLMSLATSGAPAPLSTDILSGGLGAGIGAVASPIPTRTEMQAIGNLNPEQQAALVDIITKGQIPELQNIDLSKIPATLQNADVINKFTQYYYSNLISKLLFGEGGIRSESFVVPTQDIGLMVPNEEGVATSGINYIPNREGLQTYGYNEKTGLLEPAKKINLPNAVSIARNLEGLDVKFYPYENLPPPYGMQEHLPATIPRGVRSVEDIFGKGINYQPIQGSFYPVSTTISGEGAEIMPNTAATIRFRNPAEIGNYQNLLGAEAPERAVPTGKARYSFTLSGQEPTQYLGLQRNLMLGETPATYSFGTIKGDIPTNYETLLLRPGPKYVPGAQVAPGSEIARLGGINAALPAPTAITPPLPAVPTGFVAPPPSSVVPTAAPTPVIYSAPGGATVQMQRVQTATEQAAAPLTLTQANQVAAQRLSELSTKGASSQQTTQLIRDIIATTYTPAIMNELEQKIAQQVEQPQTEIGNPVQKAIDKLVEQPLQQNIEQNLEQPITAELRNEINQAVEKQIEAQLEQQVEEQIEEQVQVYLPQKKGLPPGLILPTPNTKSAKLEELINGLQSTEPVYQGDITSFLFPEIAAGEPIPTTALGRGIGIRPAPTPQNVAEYRRNRGQRIAFA